MLADVPTPPPIQKLLRTPVLASEIPAGFTHARVSRLAPDRRYHTLGAVRIDFSNAHTSDSASYALMRTNAAAVALARTEAHVNGGTLFRVQAAAVGRFAVAVVAQTAAQAKALLHVALAHLRRSER